MSSYENEAAIKVVCSLSVSQGQCILQANGLTLRNGPLRVWSFTITASPPVDMESVSEV